MRWGWCSLPLLSIGLWLGSASLAEADSVKHDAGSTPHLEKTGDHKTAGHDAAGGHDAHDSHAKPDPFRQALDLTIWTTVVFLLLLFVLSRFAWKPMLEGLKKREDSIRSAMLDAQKARDEAQQIRAQLEKELNNASERVREILDEARRDAQRTTEDMVAHARQEISTERDRLHREMAMARDQALQQIWNQGADLALLISAKTVRRNLTPDDHRRLVDEALADLGKLGGSTVREITKIM